MEGHDINEKFVRLMEVGDELRKLNEDARDEFWALAQKHNEIQRPIFLRRNEIIKTIPDFWLTAFLSHPTLGPLLSDEDQKIFTYLDSLDMEIFPDVKSGFRITFNMKPNPYFENTKLMKTYYVSDEGGLLATGTIVNWKKGANHANEVDHEKKGNKRPLPETVYSFFCWFDYTETNLGLTSTCCEVMRVEVGWLIKDDLWRHPLKYFSNESDDEESYRPENSEDNEDE